MSYPRLAAAATALLVAYLAMGWAAVVRSERKLEALLDAYCGVPPAYSRRMTHLRSRRCS